MAGFVPDWELPFQCVVCQLLLNNILDIHMPHGASLRMHTQHHVLNSDGGMPALLLLLAPHADAIHGTAIQSSRMMSASATLPPPYTVACHTLRMAHNAWIKHNDH